MRACMRVCLRHVCWCTFWLALGCERPCSLAQRSAAVGGGGTRQPPEGVRRACTARSGSLQ